MITCPICNNQKTIKQKSTRPVLLDQQIIFVDIHYKYCPNCDIDFADENDMLLNQQLMKSARAIADKNFKEQNH